MKKKINLELCDDGELRVKYAKKPTEKIHQDSTKAEGYIHKDLWVKCPECGEKLCFLSGHGAYNWRVSCPICTMNFVIHFKLETAKIVTNIEYLEIICTLDLPRGYFSGADRDDYIDFIMDDPGSQF